jgi:hypothetical protein
MPRLLELCCGTAQVSKYFLAEGWEVVTVDCLSKFQPTILADVRDIDPTRWQPGEFDVVWASPPCTAYSIARSTAPRDFAQADEIVCACFAIIRHLTNCEKDVAWFCENPATGYLKSRPCMQEWAGYKRTLCYCSYGKPFRKATCIWTNIDTWTPRPMCLKGSRCDAYLGTHHPKSAQKGPSKIQGVNPPGDLYRSEDLYGIPWDLISDLFSACVQGRR